MGEGMTYVNKYQQIAQEDIGAGVIRNQISRLLRSIDSVGWSKREEAGRLDKRALTRFACGEASIFSRREYKEAEKSSVMIMVDCSGSMGSRIGEAQKVSIHLGEILNKTKVPFAVYGFGNHELWYETVNGEYVEIPTFIKFKTWGERLGNAQGKLGFMHKLANGGTPDYSSLYWAIDEISRRPEQRRVLFFLTDATGYIQEHVRHLEVMAEKLGVTLVVIGVCSHSVEKVFTNSVNIKTASELKNAMFQKLIRTLTK